MWLSFIGNRHLNLQRCLDLIVPIGTFGDISRINIVERWRYHTYEERGRNVVVPLPVFKLNGYHQGWVVVESKTARSFADLLLATANLSCARIICKLVIQAYKLYMLLYVAECIFYVQLR